MDLRAVIVEDEKRSREILKSFIEKFCTDIEVIGMAEEVEEAVNLIRTKKPDLIFLDIELRSGTGFDILEQTSQMDFEVIFTTAFDQYGIKAVKYSSLDYLLKPIDIEELQASIEKARVKKNQEVYKKQLEILMHNLKQEKSSFGKLCLATNDGFEFINIRDILYCKAEGSYTVFLVEGSEKHIVSKHLKEYESLIDNDFMRVHKSFLINIRKVKKYVKSDGGYIVMDNGDVVSISRSKKEDFIRVMSALQ